MFHGILSDYTHSQLVKDHEEYPFHPLGVDTSALVKDKMQVELTNWPEL